MLISPTLNIIHDLRMMERYSDLMRELANQGITDFKIWQGLMYPDSVIRSISDSHKMIVAAAKESGLPEVCIAEDDIMFPALGAWQYFLSQKPQEYDLYLAATYVVPPRPVQVCGFHLYFVHENFYDKFLSVPDNLHIDGAMDDIEGEKNYHVCYPMAALQRPCRSANIGAMVNYNNKLNMKDVYKG